MSPSGLPSAPPTLEPLQDPERQQWLSDAEQRVAGNFVVAGLASVAQAQRRARELLSGLHDPKTRARHHLARVRAAEEGPGVVWWHTVGAEPNSPARVLEPSSASYAGESPAALVEVVTRATARHGSPQVSWQTLGPGDALQEALADAGFTVSATEMVRALEEDDASVPDGLELRPMSEQRFGAYRVASTAEYAADVIASGLLPEVEAHRKAEDDFASELPQGLRTPDHRLLTANLPDDDAEVGILWWAQIRDEQESSGYIYDIELAESHRGRGLGRQLLLSGHAEMWAGGATSVGLNVFGHNARARGLYDATGYVPVTRTWSRNLAPVV